MREALMLRLLLLTFDRYMLEELGLEVGGSGRPRNFLLYDFFNRP